MLEITQLLEFAKKYQDEVSQIDKEIEVLNQKKVVTLAKVDVVNDFIAFENSFQRQENNEQETTVEEDYSMGEEITYQGGSL